MPQFKVEITTLAEEEFNSVFQYYEQQGKGLGIKFSKEIDIKLKFSILPDGSVGKIIPLMKADTRLEMAAINSLRNWRFEPLRIGQKKNEQSVVITFPYRLR